MIASLRIENFALIDEVHIQFTKGFTVITGETGSGKSILLNALNLILGERANFSVIGDRKDKSIVEAHIEIADFDLKSFFEKEKLILISDVSDKILNLIEEIIASNINDIVIILIAKRLEKKSKIRSYFEKTKETLIVPFYEDTPQTLLSIAKKILNSNHLIS